ncbi:MAG: hypothetical protein EON60_02315 [Alphaproteobacteria bacterium]|nr:MAG: hypothetical protein EON60_02315 [Alphaproteobacteria bacterium]
MLVLEMLREHPLVHTKQVDVEVMANGDVAVAGVKRSAHAAHRMVCTLTLPMLVFGKPELQEDVRTLMPELTFFLPTDGFAQGEMIGEWEYPSAAECDVKTIKLEEGFFFIRRDRNTSGRRPTWDYHLFFTADTSTHVRSLPPFWENPPIARLEPWRERVEAVLYQAGYARHLVQVEDARNSVV